MPKKVMIIFWGHPLYDGRCMNMINQFMAEQYQVYVLGVGEKQEKLNYEGVEIELINQKN